MNFIINLFYNNLQWFIQKIKYSNGPQIIAPNMGILREMKNVPLHSLPQIFLFLKKWEAEDLFFYSSTIFGRYFSQINLEWNFTRGNIFFCSLSFFEINFLIIYFEIHNQVLKFICPLFIVSFVLVFFVLIICMIFHFIHLLCWNVVAANLFINKYLIKISFEQRHCICRAYPLRKVFE